MLQLGLFIMVAVMFGILALSAGRWDVWGFWAWCGVMYLTAAITYAVLGRVNPGLVKERMKPPSDRDRATRRLVILPLLGLLVLSGLDVRFGWSAVPFAVQLVGVILNALGFALVGWVLLTNPYASSAVRIQEERGQKVITTGPYALVRHPMYLATFLVCLGSGPALGSWIGTLALLPVVVIFVRRTLIEDRMLHRELSGYDAYAARVRWKVIPFVF